MDGFIRIVWKGNGLDGIGYPPDYLIQIIRQYYQNEMLYLFTTNDLVWKINTDDILN